MDTLKKAYQVVADWLVTLGALSISIMLCTLTSVVLHLGTALLLGSVPSLMGLGFHVPGIIDAYPEGTALRIGDVSSANLLALAGCVVGAVWGTVRFALRKRA